MMLETTVLTLLCNHLDQGDQPNVGHRCHTMVEENSAVAHTAFVAEHYWSTSTQTHSITHQ